MMGTEDSTHEETPAHIASNIGSDEWPHTATRLRPSG
jgi:hypothetical protein